jgi:hypothetical protein
MEIAMSEEEKVEDGSVEVVIEEAAAAEASAPEREPQKEEQVAPAKSDKDLEEHSESVRKRIDKLTYKVREAERREQAALEYARGLKGQLETYQERASRLDKSLVQEFDNRLKTQEKMIREELRRAIDEGNIDAQIEAQSSLAALAVENDRLRQSRLRREQEEAQRQAAVARPQPQAPVVPQAPQPDPKARSWAERNEWFGNDRAMTATAYAIHADLVEVEGFDPASDEYYQELDNRIRTEFPHKFKPAQTSGSQAQRPQSMVAPARTTVKSGSTKVKLTESQIRVAKALGVSLEEYARHTRMQQQG